MAVFIRIIILECWFFHFCSLECRFVLKIGLTSFPIFLGRIIVTSIDILWFIRYWDNVDHVPQGIFRHPTLTEILLNSEVVHSVLFLPALLNSSSFLWPIFKMIYILMCLPANPNKWWRIFKKWENPLNYAHNSSCRFFTAVGAI